MTDKLKQTIKEEVVKLPKEKQDAINSLDWGNIAEGIGKKYLLDERETNDLQVETLLVLVGIEDIEAYPRNIENNVETSKDEAMGIAEEVNEKIFTPIYNVLTENIKKNLGSQRPKLDQNVNFILSGGDYSAFMQGRDDNAADDMPKTNKPLGTSSILDLKDRLIDINKK